MNQSENQNVGELKSESSYSESRNQKVNHTKYGSVDLTMNSKEIAQSKNGSGNLTMDSREIAELTGKQHAHVCRDIKKQLDSQGINQSIFGSVYLDVNNQKRKCYKLDYEQTMILLTGYSVPLRAKVIKRWRELEAKTKVPSSYAQALLEAGRLALEVEEKEALLIKQAPKVEFADKVVRDETTHFSITDVGKQIGMRQSEIFSIMREKHLITKKNVPTQNAIDRNLLTLRINIIGDKNIKQAVMTGDNIYNFNRIYGKGDIKLPSIDI